MITNTEVKIYFQKKNYSIYYSYNYNSTFQDLLEYIAYLLPELNICECFEFIAQNNNFNYYYNNNKEYFSIPNNYLISKYTSYLKGLYLNNNGQLYCPKHNINYLNYSKKSLFSFLQNEINSYNSLKEKNKNNESEIINLKDKNKQKTDKINKLKEEKEKKILEINNLEGDIKNLNKDKKYLEIAINGDIEKINLLNNLGVKGDNLKEKDNIIQIDKYSNKIIGNQKYIKEKFINFYDVIIHIDSIKDINKGWRVEFSQKAKEKYESFKKDKIIKIGIIGNSNKGKSFLLSKISKIQLPSGTSIRTEGLSIKYPEIEKFKDRKIALLDSAGLETPVLNINGKSSDMDDKKNELFKEKSREKLITELFLQNYIINNSDVLIAVVGILTYSEQKLLMKIKKEIERSKINTPLFIIHNLITYTSVTQVKDYIKEFLLKSATFILEEGHKISTKIESKTGIYYYELNKEQKIYHLIYANEGSEAGLYYNQFTLDFLENNYQNVTHLKPFDVIDTIKERYIILSKDIIERTDTADGKIDKNSFEETDANLIKLKDAKEIILKKCLTDELGFSNLKANGFEPTYNLFKKDDKIILRVEAPGNCEIESNYEFAGEYNIIKLNGVKKRDKEPQEEDKNIFNTRENGNFVLDIPLKADEYLLSNEEPDIKANKGVFILEYKLAKKSQKKHFKYTDGNEEL